MDAISIWDTYTHTTQTQDNSSHAEYKAQSDPFQKVTEVLFAHLSYSKSLLKINHVQLGS